MILCTDNLFYLCSFLLFIKISKKTFFEYLRENKRYSTKNKEFHFLRQNCAEISLKNAKKLLTFVRFCSIFFDV